ncbi:uncharacterized protein LOC116339842 [Contarinia nasturtii]|uniref:uncharacterized protein LOC116339842 n=1 Tax=Contarinia nasturtii TaxID=265458 RepID=UPI0012D40786|nr:uncharacterized protein LOC116339842 [Contarinia nasturtii]
MKCFSVFVIVCCVVSCVTAPPPPAQEPPPPALVTGASYILQKSCSPVNSLVLLGVSKAASEGVTKYQETKDVALALKVAANSGFQGAADFLTCASNACIDVAAAGCGIAKDIYVGKDVKQAVVERTKLITEAGEYLKYEFTSNPKGKVANAMVTGGNVAMTWFFGPFSGYITAALAKAAADGIQKYHETKDIAAAANLAAQTGFNSAASFIYAAAGLVTSGSELVKDLAVDHVDPKEAVKKRGHQALESIIDPMGTKKKSTTARNPPPTPSQAGPSNRNIKPKTK